MSKRKYPESLPNTLINNLEAIGDFRYKSFLSEFLGKLFDDFDVRLVALYGSIARKKDTYASDIDLFLVAKDFPTSLNKRLDKLYKYFIPYIDFKAHTPQEFQDMLDNWHLTILEVLNDNHILFDPDRVAEKAKNKMIELINTGKLARKQNYWQVYV